MRIMQNTSGDPTAVTGMVARSSNGSTYQENTRNGETLIMIEDLPHQRTIVLYPKNHEYQVSAPVPALKARALSPDEGDPETLARVLSTRPAKTTSDNGDVITQIGRKKIEGLDVFGQTYAFTDGRVQETWYCPKLDLHIESKMQANGNGPDYVHTITQIQLVEPDPKLFMIPAGYTQQERNREMVGRFDP